MARIIGRIVLPLAVLAVASFLTLVLVAHLWDRYEAETVALGFGGIYERYLAFQAGFSDDPKARATAEAERARQEATGGQQLSPARVFQQQGKLVGSNAVGSTNLVAPVIDHDGNF